MHSDHLARLSEHACWSRPPPHPAMVPDSRAATAEPRGLSCAAVRALKKPHLVMATPCVRTRSGALVGHGDGLTDCRLESQMWAHQEIGLGLGSGPGLGLGPG